MHSSLRLGIGCCERELRLAVELDPRSAGTHLWFALFLGMRGHLREALVEVMAARAIDPLSLTVNTALGFQFYLSSRSAEQIEQHRRTLELEPDFAIGHWALGLAHAHRGQYREAISAQQRACELMQGNLLMQTVLARYLAMAGEVAQAQEMLAELEAAGPVSRPIVWQRSTPPSASRTVRSSTSIALARSATTGWSGSRSIRWSRICAPSRFPELLRRVGLA